MMGQQGDLFPEPPRLSASQLQRLTDLANASGAAASEVLVQVADHEARARREHAKSPLVNVRFAAAISQAYCIIVDIWDELPEVSRYWLRASMLYFVSSDDEEPDFGSVIGFEDDCEVLNACLHFAGREDLCLNPENYDDA